MYYKSWFKLGRSYPSRNLSLSSRFSRLLECKFLMYSLNDSLNFTGVYCDILFSFLISLIRVIFFFLLVSLAKSLLILFFQRTFFFVLLILCIVPLAPILLISFLIFIIPFYLPLFLLVLTRAWGTSLGYLFVISLIFNEATHRYKFFF
jgi:hypothetical protein